LRNIYSILHELERKIAGKMNNELSMSYHKIKIYTDF